MRLKVIATGSSGNCYALEREPWNILLLDLGIPKKEILKGLDFNIRNVSGAVVGHVHQDHAKSVKDFEKMGIPIFKPYETDWKSRRCDFRGFKAYSFPVEHDGTPCCGFLIDASGKHVLYVTDAEYVKYQFKDYEPVAIIVECNYQEEYVDMDEEKASHVLRGHLGLQTCIKFLKSNQTDKLRTVVLCHMSETNCNPYECQTAVQNALGEDVEVVVAVPGKVVDL